MTEINIDAPSIETIKVNLVGKSYDILPPKTALAMKLMVQSKTHSDDPEKLYEVLTEWMKRAFGANFKKVEKRLEDEKDSLDLPQVMELMEKVIEYQTELPTT